MKIVLPELTLSVSQPLADRPKVVLIESSDGRRAVLGDGNPLAEMVMERNKSDGVDEFRAELVKSSPALLEKLARIFQNLQIREDTDLRAIALALTIEVAQAIKSQNTKPRAKLKPSKSAAEPKQTDLDAALNAAISEVLSRPAKQ